MSSSLVRKVGTWNPESTELLVVDAIPFWVQMWDSCDQGGGIGWLAAGGIPKSLSRVPFFNRFLACALSFKKKIERSF